MEPAWLLQETPRNRSMLAAGEREREWARRRVCRRAGGGHAGRSGGGVRSARVQAAALPAVDPANMLAMDPCARRRGIHRGPASDRLRYTTVFHPAGRQNVGFLNLWLAAGWCHLQVGGFGPLRRLRRRPAHSKGAVTRGFRVPAPVVLLRTCVWGVLRHQGDEGPSNDALRAGFSTRPSRCGCAGYTCARGRCPSRADGRPGRR